MTRAVFQSFTGSDPDVACLNLNRLLARLEQNLLSPFADLKLLQESRYHRARVGANIDYARNLQEQFERSLQELKSPERRHDRQIDLTRKRQTLNLLKARLDAIAAEAEAQPEVLSQEEEKETQEEEREIVMEIEDEDEEESEPLVTPSTTEGSHDGYWGRQGEGDDGSLHRVNPRIEAETAEDKEVEDKQHLNLGFTATATIPPSTSSTSTLRYRHDHRVPPPAKAAATTTATATSMPTRSASPTTTLLFPHNTKATPPQLPSLPQPPTMQAAISTESTLSAHRQEQETLTDSLLTLATQLKTSSQAFQSSLKAEKAVLSRAGEGLDQNLTGMDAAGKRMGMLRRMTEGRGWWGRVLMYVWIFALWFIALGIVFLGPKLRF